MSSAALQFAKIQNPKILVLGDLILDRYTFGNAERVSPEAPVLVLRADAQEVRLGGAASVAFLLRALEAQVSLAGVIGDDSAGRMVQKLIANAEIDARFIRVDADRPTTTKERFVGRAADRHPHQMLRVDSESREPIRGELESDVLNALLNELPDFEAVLVSDYAKGVCTFRLLNAVISAARAGEIPVIVDPARIIDYSRYHGATLIKPNRAEAELATGAKIQSPQDALFVAKKLCWKCESASVLVTLDQQGMALFEDDESKELFPTEPREVYDITGAGDMVLAALGLCLASNIPLADSVRIANTAAGLEVERLGVAPVSRNELAWALLPQEAAGVGRAPSDGPVPSTCSRRERKAAEKILTADQAAVLAAKYRAQGKSVVFTNGCFDLLHVGHLATLQGAAGLGDVLFVGINADDSVRALKGADRPVIPARDRAMLTASLACVDHAVIFDQPTPHTLLEAIRPDILVKGGTTADITGHEVVESYGGRVLRLATVPDVSTTEIINRIHHSFAPPVDRAVAVAEKD